jgi:hypothetical protein
MGVINMGSDFAPNIRCGYAWYYESANLRCLAFRSVMWIN